MELAENTINSFVDTLTGFFGSRLVSVVLYGSITFDDLAPGYGDLDFLAVVDDDLSDEDCRLLVDMRKPLRSAGSSVYAKMLEGAFLPRRMLDPNVKGKAFWWGTTTERPRETNQLGPLVLHVIREMGWVIWGQDIRPEIPAPTREEMVGEVREFAASLRQHGRGGDLHSIDWLLTSARLLLWLREDRLSSKTQAADWGCANAEGGWRMELPKAKALRLNPSSAGSPDVHAWLDGLNDAIQSAGDELERALARFPRQ